MRKQGHPPVPSQKSWRAGQAQSYAGLVIAFSVITAWGVHLAWILHLNLFAGSPVTGLGAVLIQAFLNTGLFVTAHDAIHGLVCPKNQAINTSIGCFCCAAYAALAYPNLRRKHWLHHRAPMSTLDPDFCRITNANFWTCYQHFMGQYLDPRQLLTLAGTVITIAFIWQLSLLNLIVGWGVPLLLSSIQLFYVGTYCPHQKAADHQISHTCTPSTTVPWLWSLLLCYHFCYHQEHHDHPNVPWWQLPNVHRQIHAPKRFGD